MAATRWAICVPKASLQGRRFLGGSAELSFVCYKAPSWITNCELGEGEGDRLKEEGEGQVEVSSLKWWLIKTIERASVAFGHRKKRLHSRLS